MRVRLNSGLESSCVSATVTTDVPPRSHNGLHFCPALLARATSPANSRTIARGWRARSQRQRSVMNAVERLNEMFPRCRMLSFINFTPFYVMIHRRSAINDYLTFLGRLRIPWALSIYYSIAPNMRRLL